MGGNVSHDASSYDDSMDIYINLKGHANNSSLPLRMGIRLTQPHQRFATLRDAAYDEAGTNSQRPSEIEQGRRHYTGTLVIPNESPEEGPPHELPCRVVLGAPSSAGQRPPVITVLRTDNSKGDLTVTRHIEGMLKRGKISAIDLIQVFNPAYVRGEIQSSNDCEEIFDRYLRTPISVISAGDPTARAILEDPGQLVEALEEVVSEELALKAPPKFKPLAINGVKYKYVMAEAYIVDVRMNGDVIMLTVVDSNGNERTLHSFKPRQHLLDHHRRAFSYLSERKEQRAFFAICDSEPCRGFLAESVTSIALQVMQSTSAAAAVLTAVA